MSDAILAWISDLDWGLILAGVAILISLWSLKISKDQNRALHKPALRGFVYTAHDLYKYTITNRGSGPAYFSGVEFFFDSKRIEPSDVSDTISKFLSGFGIAFQPTITVPGAKSVMAVGDSIDLVCIQFDPSQHTERDGIDASRFSVRIEYTSALGDTFVFESST